MPVTNKSTMVALVLTLILPSNQMSLSTLTPPSTCSAPVVEFVALTRLVNLVMLVTVREPCTRVSPLRTSKGPAGSRVIFPVVLIKELPLSARFPTLTLAGSNTTLFNPSVMVRLVKVVRLTVESPKLTSPVR